nr:MAG TPA: Single strand binding protein [Caudoviricetes sp.]
MGRLVRDPEVRYAQAENPMAVSRYTLAIDRRGIKKKEGDQKPETDFINCIAFGKSGEFAEKYFRRGLRVLVSGRIQTGSYVNKDGNKVYTTDVIVEDQEFADSKNQNAENGGAGNNQQGTGSAASGDGFMNMPNGAEDEGLPFN